MSDEIKKTVLNTLAEPIANLAKNVTDKPTQNIGTTLADIWYLVFGGISQAAEKRKLKYSYALQEFEEELKEKISKIPEDKLIEPDIQIVAPALEAAKYCIENTELRKMFSKLISSSMNIDITDFSQPLFIDILKNFKPLDCEIIDSIFKNTEYKIHTKFPQNSSDSIGDIVGNTLSNSLIQIYISLNKLNHYGLIDLKLNKSNYSNQDKLLFLEYIDNNQITKIKQFFNTDIIQKLELKGKGSDCIITFQTKVCTITPLGAAFKIVCIE